MSDAKEQSPSEERRALGSPDAAEGGDSAQSSQPTTELSHAKTRTGPTKGVFWPPSHSLRDQQSSMGPRPASHAAGVESRRLPFPHDEGPPIPMTATRSSAERFREVPAVGHRESLSKPLPSNEKFDASPEDQVSVLAPRESRREAAPVSQALSGSGPMTDRSASLTSLCLDSYVSQTQSRPGLTRSEGVPSEAPRTIPSRPSERQRPQSGLPPSAGVSSSSLGPTVTTASSALSRDRAIVGSGLGLGQGSDSSMTTVGGSSEGLLKTRGSQ